MLYYVLLYCVILCCIVLHYDMLCYIHFCINFSLILVPFRVPFWVSGTMVQESAGEAAPRRRDPRHGYGVGRRQRNFEIPY